MHNQQTGYVAQLAQLSSHSLGLRLAPPFSFSQTKLELCGHVCLGTHLRVLHGSIIHSCGILSQILIAYIN